MNKVEDSRCEDELVIQGTTVFICTPNDNGIIRKQTFDFASQNQPITRALFTFFPSSPPTETASSTSVLKTDLSPARPSSTPAKALVVLLTTLIHIIYLDGGSYIVHVPFPVINVWSIPLGLLLERQPDSPEGPAGADESFITEDQLPRLFTLSSPLDEFGVVTCNGAALDPDEEIVFVSSQTDSLCVTRNSERNRITFWYASPDPRARRKVFPIFHC
jgi:Anaphase-promoting complex subunit 1 WD40 beta-propeller domain